jgi:hypothetical protein
MSWVGVSAVNNYIDGSMRAVGHTLHLLFASCHRSCPVLSCPVLPCPALSCPGVRYSTAVNDGTCKTRRAAIDLRHVCSQSLTYSKAARRGGWEGRVTTVSTHTLWTCLSMLPKDSPACRLSDLTSSAHSSCSLLSRQTREDRPVCIRVSSVRHFHSLLRSVSRRVA